MDYKKVFVFMQNVQKKMEAKKIEYNKLYDRRLFFVHFPKEVLKIEFTDYPFVRLKPFKRASTLKIDSLLDIAANKLFSMYERFEPKDYIDLFFILRKKYQLSSIQKATEKKFGYRIDGLNLGSTLMKGSKLPHIPYLVSKIKKAEIESFYADLSLTLKPKIIDE